MINCHNNIIIWNFLSKFGRLISRGLIYNKFYQRYLAQNSKVLIIAEITNNTLKNLIITVNTSGIFTNFTNKDLINRQILCAEYKKISPNQKDIAFHALINQANPNLLFYLIKMQLLCSSNNEQILGTNKLTNKQICLNKHEEEESKLKQ